MLLNEIVETSARVTSTRARSEKTHILADLLSRLSADEAPAAVSFLSGKPTQPRLGVGYAAVYAVDVEPAPIANLEVIDVDEALDNIAEASGPGSKKLRHEMLAGLLGKATLDEQEFLRGLILRNLRQGALEGVMAEAVARALDVSIEDVRRAAMLEGDLVAVASQALTEGPASLAKASLKVFIPVQPMLATNAETVTEALGTVGEAVIEQKLDGLRLQVHRDGKEVAVYTRNLRDITAGMAEVVTAAQGFKAQSMILDGEGLIIGSDGAPLSFQDSMSTRKSASPERFRAFYFDILMLNDEELIDWPLAERRKRLAAVVPAGQRVGSVETGDPKRGESFFKETLKKGFEGVVVKDPAQSYAAGRRGSGWIKVKPTHTLDLVILAVEWGSGRRQGWLSNLHLGARHGGEYVMLGKTFKGLTDAMLATQTARFLEIETRRDGHVVFVKPEIVYEIAFDGVQRSSRYPGGVALRFARVKRFRDDKGPMDADTLETVQAFLD